MLLSGVQHRGSIFVCTAKWSQYMLPTTLLGRKRICTWYEPGNNPYDEPFEDVPCRNITGLLKVSSWWKQAPWSTPTCGWSSSRAGPVVKVAVKGKILGDKHKLMEGLKQPASQVAPHGAVHHQGMGGVLSPQGRVSCTWRAAWRTWRRIISSRNRTMHHENCQPGVERALSVQVTQQA